MATVDDDRLIFQNLPYVLFSLTLGVYTKAIKHWEYTQKPSQKPLLFCCCSNTAK